jgi:hypothetical protein
MPKRLKAAKEWGIRPHVFHMWADQLLLAIDMQHERNLAHRLPPNTQELTDEELREVTEVFSSASVSISTPTSVQFGACFGLPKRRGMKVTAAGR